MSVFQYSKLQRVTVPEAMAGAKDVQGIIAEGHAELGAEPRYILQWPNADKLGDNGLFAMVVGEVGQGALIQAQPPRMVPEAQAHKNAQAAHENGRKLERELMAMERQLRATHRQISAARRKRKPAGKTKPKSKRKH